MKFLADAQLPRDLVRHLQQAGHAALHTFDLPLGNRTPDRGIVAIAQRDGRVVVTTDADFVNSFWVSGGSRWGRKACEGIRVSLELMSSRRGGPI